MTRIAATIILVVENLINITSTSTITYTLPSWEIEFVYDIAVDKETVFLYVYFNSYLLPASPKRKIPSRLIEMLTYLNIELIQQLLTIYTSQEL